MNGWPIERSQMNLVSAYVEQTDNFIDVMTVRETLIFHVSSCRKMGDVFLTGGHELRCSKFNLKLLKK